MENVSIRYQPNAAPAVKDFSLSAEPGEFVSILGHSGAGKTTALRAIAGLERISDGYIRIGGHLVSSSFVHVEPDARRVGLVFQDYALFGHMTTEQNIRFGLHDMGTRSKIARVKDMVSITGLSGLEKRYPGELSGGQQQRVALARSLAPSPAAVLMDEPFSNLDRELSATVRREVKRIIKEAGVTAILVTHNGEEALAMCDKVAVMSDLGHVEQFGRSDEVYSRPVSADVARLVGPCELADGVIAEEGVQVEMGLFPFSSPNQNPTLSTGSEVTVLMRASELELLSPESDHAGIVAFREFMGEFTEFGIRFPSSAVVKVRQRSSVPYAVGDAVSVRPRQNSQCLVFPKRSN